ncbi:MAG: cytochrome C biogenesis protein [Saprospiraceae bacterium]|nr:cytochrome C biogenesis protein [Saprospiraceae bacterium]
MQKILNIKRLIFLIGMVFLNFSHLIGQKLSPVTWSFELLKTKGSDYEIVAPANIKNGWTLYSQFTDENGPVPTAFVLGNVTVPFEEKSKFTKEFDPIFEVDVIKFKEHAIFTHKVTKAGKNEVTGYVTFMTCDGEKCLPPSDVEFTLKF